MTLLVFSCYHIDFPIDAVSVLPEEWGSDGDGNSDELVVLRYVELTVILLLFVGVAYNIH